jgi:hypothetical protein
MARVTAGCTIPFRIFRYFVSLKMRLRIRPELELDWNAMMRIKLNQAGSNYLVVVEKKANTIHNRYGSRPRYRSGRDLEEAVCIYRRM